MKLKIVNKDDKFITLSWDLLDGVVSYNLEGLTNLFNYEVIDQLHENKIKLELNSITDYLKFRVNYIVKKDGKDTSLYITNEIDVNENFSNLDFILNDLKDDLNLNFTKSYKGGCISVDYLKIYDKYLYYLVKDNDLELISEGEDPILASDKVKENETYYVEAYKDDRLLHTSKQTVCEFKKIENNEIKLSIIIPAYNASIFISRTIDSIIASNTTNYELILVNDGSKDNTLEILNWYKDNYSFIKVIDKENTGVCDTRNVGVNASVGKYIAFVDADDIITTNMYKLLLESIEKENGDIAIARTLERLDRYNKKYVLDVPTEEKYLVYDYPKVMIEKNRNSFNNIYFVAVWNKIVKREIALKIRFPKNPYYEDMAYTAALYSYADKFIFVKDAIYIWDKRNRNTTGSLSTSYSEIKFYETVRGYFNSLSFPIKACNKDKLKYVEFDAYKGLYKYATELKGHKMYDDYVLHLKELLNNSNIDNNEFIRSDKELYKNLLEIKKKSN